MEHFASEMSDPRAAAVLTAMADYELTQSSAWNDLDALATHVHVDDVEVDPAGIIFNDAAEFRGSVSIYVVLRYGSDRDEDMETTESFRGRFTGHISDVGTAKIDDVTVDTSPFFEGEAS